MVDSRSADGRAPPESAGSPSGVALDAPARPERAASPDAATPTAFQQSVPVLVTSLVNKSGAIGLSLLPMLLVDGQYSVAQSGLAMGVVKGCTAIAILGSGWLGDHISLRRTVLGALLLAGFGLLALPMPWGFAALLISAAVAQLGITSINAMLRLLLTRTVYRHLQRESLGWMRMVNNLGQVLSFGLATMTATLGPRMLIWFDALTSFLAFGIGMRILPRDRSRTVPLPGDAAPRADERDPAVRGWWPFVSCVVLISAWNFQYDLYMVGVAGRLKLQHPEDGLRTFALVMVLNTVLCAALAVAAARVFTRVVPSLVLSVVLSTVGVLLAIGVDDSPQVLFASALCVTLGEIVFGALGSFLLIRAVPPGPRENMVYSSGLLVTSIARALAAGAAFPLVVYSTDPYPAAIATMAAAATSFTILSASARSLGRLAMS